MARILKGILGSVSGTVGTIVGASWRGINYIRSKAGVRRKNDSEKQQVQQARFRLMAEFLQTMKDLLALGFKNQAVKMTEQNAAMGYNLTQGIGGQYPNFTIAYSQVQVSQGKLPNVPNGVAAAGAAGVINFSWTDNSGTGKAGENDQAILVAYCEALQRTVYIIDSPRSASAGSLHVPAFSGHPVQTWLSFITEDEKAIATSIFTGVVNVL
jgi:hypothetical protein